MTRKGFDILGGRVWVSDQDNGTTRPTWLARLGASVGADRITAQGDGKAPHVALNRAGTRLCENVSAHRRGVKGATRR